MEDQANDPDIHISKTNTESGKYSRFPTLNPKHPYA